MKFKKLIPFLLMIVMLISAFTVVNAFAREDDTPINVNESKIVDVYDGEITYIMFVPEKSGSYTFYSVSEDDTYGYLFDEELNILAENDDGEDNEYGDYNFSITYDLEANTVYYWGVKYYDPYMSGSVEVMLIENETVCEHTNTEEVVIKRASMTEDGEIEVVCSDCGEFIETKAIAMIKKVSLSKTKYAYDGNAKKPAVIVEDSNGNTLEEGTDYTLKYASGRKNVGKYTVKVTFIGKYQGTASLSFEIYIAAVSGVKTTVDESSIKVSWTKMSSVTKYEVYRATSKDGKYKKIATTSSTSYKDSGLSIGKTFYYKVRAYKTINDKKYYGEFSSAVSGKTAVKAPVIEKKATVTSDTIKISWEKTSGVLGYYVYRKSGSSSWKKIATISNASTVTYTDKKLSGSTYSYYVCAYKKISGKTYTGAKSEIINVSLLSAPKMKAWSDDDTNRTNTVMWKKVSGATGYQIYRKTGEDGSWSKIATVGKVSSYKDQVSKYGVYYYYKVRAIYKNDGTTSYGPFSGSKGRFWYQNPDVYVYMVDETDSNCYAVPILITNNGSSTIRIYSKGAEWIDNDYYEYDRDAVLYDTDKFENTGKLVKVNYVDIKPGESKIIIVGVVGNPTYYDTKTRIRLQMRYQNVYYTITLSKYYGSTYREND